MSEPVQTDKLDLTELDHALNEEGAASTSRKDNSLASHSETLSQPPADATAAQVVDKDKEEPKREGSPDTLSPNSARSLSPVPAAKPEMASTYTAAPSPPKTTTTTTTKTTTATKDQQQQSKNDEQRDRIATPVQELKAMFPDFDPETIAAVLASSAGNQEAAVNALLQMSDPSYRPAPSSTGSQTDSDALLAQTLAAEEERNHQLRQRQFQQQQAAAAAGGRGGGGSGAFFSELTSLIGGGAGGGGSQPTTPSYDANNLTYQPRVRRQPASASARAAYAAPSPGSGLGAGGNTNQSVVPGMPGPNEAKQWQDGINRMAETGLARAASTFSSLKQRAEAALANSQTPSPGGQSTPTGSSPSGAGSGNGGGGGFWRGGGSGGNNPTTGRGGGGASSYLHNLSGAFAGHPRGGASGGSEDSVGGLASPKSPQMGDYDRDPSPVGDNELAKILARGRGNGSQSFSAGRSAVDNGKNRALADRYNTSTGGGRGAASGAGAGAGDVSTDGYSGWDQAGRTPIRINDHSQFAASAQGTGADAAAGTGTAKVKDSIAMMDSAGGRGVTSSAPAASTASTAAAAGAGAGLGLAAAAGAGATSSSSSAGGDDGSDSDDLEYVSNPFEDED